MNKYLLLSFLALSSVLTSQVNAAEVRIEHVDVFTDENMLKQFQMTSFKHAVNTPVQVHLVDGVINYEKDVAKKLGLENINPKQVDVQKLKYKATRLFNSKSFVPLRKSLEQSLITFEKTMSLGIKKVPAVVFNDKYVIYGERPLNALRIFKRLEKKGEL